MGLPAERPNGGPTIARAPLRRSEPPPPVDTAEGLREAKGSVLGPSGLDVHEIVDPRVAHNRLVPDHGYLDLVELDPQVAYLAEEPLQAGTLLGREGRVHRREGGHVTFFGRPPIGLEECPYVRLCFVGMCGAGTHVPPEPRLSIRGTRGIRIRRHGRL